MLTSPISANTSTLNSGSTQLRSGESQVKSARLSKLKVCNKTNESYVTFYIPNSNIEFILEHDECRSWTYSPNGLSWNTKTVKYDYSWEKGDQFKHALLNKGPINNLDNKATVTFVNNGYNSYGESIGYKVKTSYQP